MSVETFLEQKLQKFSIIDLSLVKSVYFMLSLMLFSLYPKLGQIDWCFYLILSLLSAMPLWIHLFAQSGDLIEKMHRYLQSNNPSNQVLLFLSVLFFSLMLGVLIPLIVSFVWWSYLIVALVLAIKPLTVSSFW